MVVWWFECDSRERGMKEQVESGLRECVCACVYACSSLCV